MKTRNNYRVSVLKNCTVIFILVCLPLKASLDLKVHCLYFFFFKIHASKLGVRLIHGLLHYLAYNVQRCVGPLRMVPTNCLLLSPDSFNISVLVSIHR